MTAEIKQFKTFRDLNKIQNESTTSTSSKTSTPSTTSITGILSTPNDTNPANTSKTTDISPKRDYQKVPNSITREALPSGVFRGKSKQVYDFLWSESRGAIVPTRFVKKSRREIKRKTAIGSMVTIDAALNHLQQIGLLRVGRAVGSLQGNQYEIFSPEEITLPSTTSISSSTSLTQKLDILDIPESGISSITQTIEKKDTYNDAKTLFKDSLKIDDEKGIIEFFEILHKASKDATGKKLTAKDLEALPNIARIIVDEINRARTNTPQVNSYLKFTEAHLRNKFESTTKVKPRPGKEKPSDVPKHALEGIESLGESRGIILGTLKAISTEQGRESVEALQKNYLPDDWNWLIGELDR